MFPARLTCFLNALCFGTPVVWMHDYSCVVYCSFAACVQSAASLTLSCHTILSLPAASLESDCSVASSPGIWYLHGAYVWFWITRHNQFCDKIWGGFTWCMCAPKMWTWVRLDQLKFYQKAGDWYYSAVLFHQGTWGDQTHTHMHTPFFSLHYKRKKIRPLFSYGKSD